MTDLMSIGGPSGLEYDFPALNRVSDIVDFTSNNNRPARRRGGKAWDEFGLVEATDAQYAENQKLTPKYTKLFEELSRAVEDQPAKISAPPVRSTDSAIVDTSPVDTNVPKPFAFMQRKNSGNLADAPAIPTQYSSQRTGQSIQLKIYHTSLEAQKFSMTVEVTTDTYFAEVLEIVCRRWNLDKAHHFLRLARTGTTAPTDRMVEELAGTQTEFELVRRRFAHDGVVGIASSPSSASLNAPLLTDVPGTPSKKNKKGAAGTLLTGTAHPLTQMQDILGTTANYRKYTVIRKQPMSFAPSHTRTLLMDGEYLHILPGEKESSKTIFESNAASGKTSTVPFSLVVWSKVSRRHPKMFRVLVFKERETKRYDFEASSPQEAGEIVGEIQEKIRPFRGLGGSQYALQAGEKR